MQTIEVRQAFDSYLYENLATLGLLPSQVSWYNVNFAPVSNELYIRPRLLFGDTLTNTLGDEGYNRTNGLYQIILLGVSNRGIYELEHLAQKILDLFPTGTTLSLGSNRALVETSYVGAFGTEDIRPAVPVTVQWTMVYQRTKPLEVILP